MTPRSRLLQVREITHGTREQSMNELHRLPLMSGWHASNQTASKILRIYARWY